MAGETIAESYIHPIEAEMRVQNPLLWNVVDKVKAVIESDKNLMAGFVSEAIETTRKDNPCSRTFAVTINIGVSIPNS